MNQPYPFPTTDIIIEYKDRIKEGIVLITRKNFPYGYAIPGGMAETGLSYEENAQKEAKEETGLDVIIRNPNKPWTYSHPSRDPRGHYTSHTYIARGFGVLQSGDDAKTANLYTLDEVVNMLGKNLFAFDHENIIIDYLKHKGCKL